MHGEAGVARQSAARKRLRILIQKSVFLNFTSRCKINEMNRKIEDSKTEKSMKFKEPLEIHFRDIEHLETFLSTKFCYFQKPSRINKRKKCYLSKKNLVSSYHGAVSVFGSEQFYENYSPALELSTVKQEKKMSLN